MMNKYQIAWEHIKTLKGSNFGYYGQFTQSFLAFEEDEKIIEEIVQKTIPKKVVRLANKNYGYSHKCPSCGQCVGTIVKHKDNFLSDYIEEDEYCPSCGQKIDWSNESE